MTENEWEYLLTSAEDFACATILNKEKLEKLEELERLEEKNSEEVFFCDDETVKEA